MKRFLLSIIFVLIASIGFSQSLTIDTTFSNGFQNCLAKVWLPPTYYSNPTDSFQLIIFMPGAGENTSSDYTKLEVYGPHAYKLRGSWNGGVTLPGGRVYYPIIVSVTGVTSNFLQPPFSNTLLENVINRYRAYKSSVHLMGLSAGAWTMNLAATYQPTLGDYSKIAKYRSVTNVQGVVPSDTYGSTPAYATRFRYFALYGANGLGGQHYGWEQTLDGRDIKKISDTMNAVVPTSGYYLRTDYDGGGHTAFYRWFGDTGAPETFTFDWGIGNVYQNAIVHGDTSLTSALTINVSGNQTIQLPTNSVSVSSTPVDGIAPYTYAWTKTSGGAATIATPTDSVTNITGLEIGSYIFRVTVTDSVGTVGFNSVSVTVGYSTSDLSVTSNNPAGTSSASLTSTLSPNHNITSTKWTKFKVPSQTQKKIVFIGSSTTAGFGTTGYVSGTTTDSSYVGRVLNYYNSLSMLTTISGVNLGQSSTDIYHAQPSWYVPPGGRNSPLAGRNITAALDLNPDVVIVNYPSNSYDFLTVTETMAGFRRIKATVDSAGKKVFFTTCQPRPGFSPTEELKLIEFSDSIRAQFPDNFIEFYYPLADETNPQAFVPAYDYGDNVHTNDAGHRQLFNNVIAVNVFKEFATSTSVITSPTTANTTVTGLINGEHKFQVTITDNRGLTASAISTVSAVVSTCNELNPVVYNISQTSPGEIYRPNGSAWKGGDTIKITGTSYTTIEFFNIAGDPCRPIVIMPLTKLTTNVFRLKGDTRYVKVIGGDSTYGIKAGIVGSGAAFAMEKVHHITVENVEVKDANVGFYLRYDVSYADTMTWYPNYLMNKITINNTWVHDIDGEGMYIGNTQPNGYTVTSGATGLDTVLIANRLDSVTISNSIVERTTWDAIQISNARNGNRIFGNTVRNYGTLNISGQQGGIILGGNSTGDIYNNTIIKGSGNGIQFFGYGTSNIYNNLIDSAGYSGRQNPPGTVVGDQSIYANDNLNTVESNPAHNVNIYNNIIKHYQNCEAIRVANAGNTSANSSVYDNQFLIPGATEGWQATRILLSPAGSTQYNNTLITAPTKIRLLIKFRQI